MNLSNIINTRNLSQIWVINLYVIQVLLSELETFMTLKKTSPTPREKIELTVLMQGVGNKMC